MGTGVRLAIRCNRESRSATSKSGRKEITRIVRLISGHFVNRVRIKRSSVLRVFTLNKNHLGRIDPHNVDTTVI